ncbi:hypothetical protein E4U41_007562 [Claviceps citrina]|nr:hypothetical protein E4U41_007562 [Claviceps citrina]
MPSPTGIQGDPALTSYGVDQSKELGAHLMTLDPPVEKVYSSPFYRCLQTMAPFMELQHQKALAAAAQRSPQAPPASGHASSGSTNGQSLSPDARHAPVPAAVPAAVTKMLPEHGIREWFGSAPFDHPEPAAPAVLKSMFPSYDQEYVSVVTPSKRGETLAQLQHRITAALRGIIEQCDADGTRAVILCSHAAVIILMGRILTGLLPVSVDVDDFKAYTCGLSVYGRQRRRRRRRRRCSVTATIRSHDDDDDDVDDDDDDVDDDDDDVDDDDDDVDDDDDATPGHSLSSRHGHLPPSSVSDAASADLIGGWDCHLNSDCSFLSGGPERGWGFSGDESFPDTGSMSLSEVDPGSSKL